MRLLLEPDPTTEPCLDIPKWGSETMYDPYGPYGRHCGVMVRSEAVSVPTLPALSTLHKKYILLFISLMVTVVAVGASWCFKSAVPAIIAVVVYVCIGVEWGELRTDAEGGK